MRSVSRSLPRVAAAFVGSLFVGVLAGGLTAIYSALTCGRTCVWIQGDATGHSKCLAYGSTCGDVVAGLLLGMLSGALLGLVLGILPGYIALTITGAKAHPWRSLLILVPASVIGFVIWLLIPWSATGFGNLALLGLFGLPTATGLIAAANIERLPQLFWPSA